MRLALICAALAACALADSASAQSGSPRRAATTQPNIVDLGVIGAAPPAAQAFTLRPAPRPTRQTVVGSLRQRFLPGIDIGETVRVTPRNLRNGPIEISMSGDSCHIDTSYGEGYINCMHLGSLQAKFTQLDPNARYLVTIEHNFGSVRVETVSAGTEHTMDINPFGQPLMLVFQTPGNAHSATMELTDIHQGTPSNTTFYALELSRLQ